MATTPCGTLAATPLVVRSSECIGINENAMLNVSVFPVPARNLVQVSTDHDAEATVFNALGSVMCNKSLRTGKNELDVSAWPSGWYLMQINTGSQLTVHRLLIE